MQELFASLELLSIREHGDARERAVWPMVSASLAAYELFWRSLVVLLTNRIDHSVPVGPEWIRLRPNIPVEYERLAMHNYSLFYYSAMAYQGIQEDREALSSGKYPHPERVFVS